ncbi:hypothetical protein [Streptomyces microflavus]|uniref:hypothetical protein n=1 Tax=Streptomyces microflavus TaxID=1919 RepID=UPI003B213163
MTARQEATGAGAAMTAPADVTAEDSAAIEAAAAALRAFARDLDAFHVRSGQRSYAQIVAAAQRGRLSKSGITDMLSGKRLPSVDFLIEFVRTVEQLGTGLTDSPQSRTLVAQWRESWAGVRLLQREAQAPRKRVLHTADDIVQRAREEAAEILSAARQEVETAFAAAGHHRVRHARAAQLQEEHLRQAQEACAALLRNAQDSVDTILREARHREERTVRAEREVQERAARRERALEERAAHVSEEAEQLDARSARLEAEAARLTTVTERHRAEASRLQTEAERLTAQAADLDDRTEQLAAAAQALQAGAEKSGTAAGTHQEGGTVLHDYLRRQLMPLRDEWRRGIHPHTQPDFPALALCAESFLPPDDPARLLAQFQQLAPPAGTWPQDDEGEATRFHQRVDIANRVAETMGDIPVFFEMWDLLLESVTPDVAFPVYSDLISRAVHALGEEAPETLTLRAHHALTMEKAGGWPAEVRRMLDSVMPLIETTFGIDDPFTQHIRQQRGWTEGTTVQPDEPQATGTRTKKYEASPYRDW